VRSPPGSVSLVSQTGCRLSCGSSGTAGEGAAWLCIAWLPVPEAACPRGAQPERHSRPSVWLRWSPACRRHCWHRRLPLSTHDVLLSPHERGSICVGAPSPLTWMMQGLECDHVASSFLSALLYNPLLGTGSGCQIASYICSFPNAPLLGANEGLIIGCKYVVT